MPPLLSSFSCLLNGHADLIPLLPSTMDEAMKIPIFGIAAVF